MLDIDVATDQRSLAMLQDALSQLPDAEYQDITVIWDNREKLTGESTNNAGGQPDSIRRRHPGSLAVLPLTGASQGRRQRYIPTD